MTTRWIVLGSLVALLGVCLGISGIPTSQTGVITVSTTSVGFPSTACRSGSATTGPEQKALVQIQTNGIFYTLSGTAATTATPASGQFVGNVGDILELAKPSLFKAIRSGAADGYFSYQCFEP